jgi:peptide-methionine (S)-S-oxide reductase
MTADAIFAGGCFWCLEKPFDHVDGVFETVSGYTGGHVENPSYEQVCRGGTGHFEAMRVTYDPARTGFAQLLDILWRNIDPFDDAGQFCDKGPQYRSAVFYGTEEEKRIAEESKAAVEARFGRKVATEILPKAKFWPAEEYHQDYYRKHPERYGMYRQGCGRDRKLSELWGRE